MHAILGSRQQELLKLLLKNKAGYTIDELSAQLEITRNGVRQHVAALEKDGYISPGKTRPSGGRPEQLYVLTDKGKEFFPRHYSWLAQLLIESIKQNSGAEGLRERLGTMGTEVARQMLSQQHTGLENQEQKLNKLSELMEQLGYNAKNATVGNGSPVIEANNCVFHNLALENPEICAFDLALVSTFMGSNVEHEGCMAKGDNSCRFKFTHKQ